MIKIIRFVLQQIKELYKLMIFLILVNFVAVALGVVSPYLSGHFIDFLIGGGSVRKLFIYCGIIISVGILNIFFGFFLNRMNVYITEQAKFKIIRYVILHIQKITSPVMQKINVGYLTQRLNNDTIIIINFSLGTIQNIIVNFLKALFSVIILFRFSNTIAILLVLFILMYYLFYEYIKKKVYIKNEKLKEQNANLYASMLEQLSHIRFIRYFGLRNTFINRMDHKFENYINSSLNYQAISYLYTGAEQIITVLAQVVLYIIGGIKVINHEMTVGEYTMMSTYFSIMLGAIKYYFGLGKSIQDAQASYDRIIAILNSKPYVYGTKKLESINKISMSDCTFSYDDSELIKNFTHSFVKNKIYVITGENGGGKSTLIDILVGFYSENMEGKVYYNDTDLLSLNIEYLLYESIGIAEQFPTFFTDTIYKNIVPYEKNINQIQLEKLLSHFGMVDKIAMLPQGLHTILDEEVPLSGGEKYKLSLIRVFLKDAEVIILDEPTASLDFESTRKLLEFIDYIKENKIIIIVSHDKLLINQADELIELDSRNHFIKDIKE